MHTPENLWITNSIKTFILCWHSTNKDITYVEAIFISSLMFLIHHIPTDNTLDFNKRAPYRHISQILSYIHPSGNHPWRNWRVNNPKNLDKCLFKQSAFHVSIIDWPSVFHCEPWCDSRKQNTAARRSSPGATEDERTRPPRAFCDGKLIWGIFNLLLVSVFRIKFYWGRSDRSDWWDINAA